MNTLYFKGLDNKTFPPFLKHCGWPEQVCKIARIYVHVITIIKISN